MHSYLNQHCESEGLYRVPGSAPQIKHWQRRFDIELDVDLLNAEDLYDPNNIGSMLKAWLRDLPSEIFPSALQTNLGTALEQVNPTYATMGQRAPQELRDALSGLPPFNYYLLFAITCHLSLLLSHTEKNKMDLNNLSICIGPCLKLERWLFNYLVGDWRHCWQGCYTEREYLEREKAHAQGDDYQPPATNGEEEAVHDDAPQDSGVEERAVSSSGSVSGASKPGSQYEDARPSPAGAFALEEMKNNDHREVVAENRAWTAANLGPQTYRPAGSSSNLTPQTNGNNVRTPTFSPPLPSPTQEMRRPSTAQGDVSQPTTPSRHRRSRSELSLSPVQSAPSAADFRFPMPEQPS